MMNTRETDGASGAEDKGKWNSINDVLHSISSLSKVTQGLAEDKDEESSGSENSFEMPQHSETSNSGENDETSNYGGGRGRFLRRLEKQFSRQHLDQSIHDDLRKVMGPGFSNELIEQYFGSPSPSSNTRVSTQETSIYPEEIEMEVKESIIMKKIADSTMEPPSSKLSFKRSKPPRCRNAVVLQLTQNKEPEKNEENDKNDPVLKGPDVFLKYKSFSSALSDPKADSGTEQSVPPLFSDKDFPVL